MPGNDAANNTGTVAPPPTWPQPGLFPEGVQDWPAHAPGLNAWTSGGPTTINLTWDSLLETAKHVDAAGAVFAEMRSQLMGVSGDLLSTVTALHWRIPGFGARLASALSMTASGAEILQRAAWGVQQAHDAYRSAESAVQQIMTLAMRLAYWEYLPQQLLTSSGDQGFIHDLTVTSGLGGAYGLAVGALTRFPIVSLMLSTLQSIDGNIGLSAIMMGRSQLLTYSTSDTPYTYSSEASAADHHATVNKAREPGDIVLTTIDGQDGAVTVVDLPQLQTELIDDMDWKRMTSPLTIVDAFSHDSAHMQQAVEDVLETAEIPEGSDVVLTGVGIGGVHAVNMAANKEFTSRYTIRGVHTIGTPGVDKRIDTSIPTVHHQDIFDPVVLVTGTTHQESSARMTVNYSNIDADKSVELGTGSAHELESNLDAMRQIIDDPDAHRWLSEEDVELLSTIDSLFEGDAKMQIFHADWMMQGDPDYKFPQEVESLDELQEIGQRLHDTYEELAEHTPQLGTEMGRQLEENVDGSRRRGR